MNMKYKFLMAGLAVCMTAPALANEGDKMDHKQAMFMKADTNDDDMLSRAEIMAAAETKFNEADTNNDDMVSWDEMKGHMDKKKAEMKGDNR